MVGYRTMLLALLIGQSACMPAQPETDSAAALDRLADDIATISGTFGAEVRFRHLTVENSPGHQVSAIYQDELSFMWFATNIGLFRYDGYEVREYRPVPFDTTSLSDPWANGLAGDVDGGLWVTTESGGLNRYNPAQDNFKRFPSAVPLRVNAVVQDAEGVLWIGATYEGLFRFDPATGRSDHFAANPGDPAALPSDRIETLLLDGTGRLWIGTTDGGLIQLDPSTNQFRTHRADLADPEGLPGASVRALHEDRQGRLWVGTTGGVTRYDRERSGFVHYSRADDTEPGADDIWALLEDPDGMIWVGSAAGLDRLDPSTGTFTSYRHDSADPTSLQRGTVRSLYFDRTGVAWVGTEQGASSFEWARPQFEHITHDPTDPNSLDDPGVWSIYEDRAGMLWVGTSAGLNRIDRSSGHVTRYAPDSSDHSRLTSRLVMGTYEARDGTFWVASRPGGLHRFDRATGRVEERFAEIPGDTTSLLSENPWWMLEDQQGRTWITSGGPGCLNEMHRATGTFTRYCHDPADPNTPAHDFARYLIESRDGTLWLGTWGGGLDRIDPATGSLTHYRHDPSDLNTPSSNFILFLREDADGVLWLGTFGAGFSRFDPDTETFTHYTSRDTELPNDVVYGIQPDDAGRLWLSTNSGLVRFDPATGAFRTFGVADGIQNVEFNSGASFRSPSGELFFGGVNGLNAFYPDPIADNPLAPSVVLTRLQVNGTPVLRHGPDSPLEYALPYAREIILRPDQRDVAITFAALHFVGPAQNQYRYRLEGYDDLWRTPGPERTATYTNLDPGRYVFRVSASNSDGVWNEDGVSIALIVAPPWWRTWWAYAFYALLFAAGVFAVDRIQRRRLIRRERERASRQNEELRMEAAEHRAKYLQSENARQTLELEQARSLQLSMLPAHMPVHPLVEVAARMRTATEVGGDYYDFHVADDGTLTVAIGDATGHGLNAGAMVTAVKSLFTAYAEESDPAEMLRKASQALRRMRLPKLYMSFALVKWRGNMVEIAGAGMPPALIHRATSGCFERVPLKGMPLGGPMQYPYRSDRIELAVGDTVLLMSDGFPELRGATSEELGYDAAGAVFAEAAGTSPEEVIRHFERTAQAWLGDRPLNDDMTFVVLTLREEGWADGVADTSATNPEPRSRARPRRPTRELGITFVNEG